MLITQDMKLNPQFWDLVKALGASARACSRAPAR